MAVPRPLLIALVGAVLAAAVFYGSQVIGASASDAGVSSETPTPNMSPSAVPGASGAAGKPAARRPARRKETLPPRVQRALDADKVMVLLFTQPGAADDDATRWASRALKGRRVAVFRDRVANVGAYGKVVAGVNLAQTPAIVVIDRDRQAQVFEGYTDRGTIRQVVRDAAR